MEVLARVRAGHDRQLGRLEIERLDAAGLDERDDAERLDAASQFDDPIRIAEAADQPAVDVDLDDVATMDALLDAVADLADEDRRALRGARAATRARRARSRVGRAAATGGAGRGVGARSRSSRG